MDVYIPGMKMLVKEKLREILHDYFSIEDSYTYELTRVKSAFEIGTMTLDDFEEWTEEQIDDLTDYIVKNLPHILVPPHGRLIDADALIKGHFSDEHRIAMSYADKCWMRRIINEEPTIIPAEEGEA